MCLYEKMEKLQNIRGAITVTANNVSEIKIAVKKLISELLRVNKFNVRDIKTLIFTATDDLNATNPATIAREEFDLDSVPMLCVQEMKIQGGLPKCIRVMIEVYTKVNKEDLQYVYLEEATKLRPDLTHEV